MLVAEDELSNEQIAAELGVVRSTLDRWKTLPDFSARVEQIRLDLQAAILAQGIANKQYRIDAANERHQAFAEIVRQRAETYGKDPEAGPGAGTGWMVRTYRFGPEGSVYEEWAVDTGLNSAMSQLEKQVAQETGQWAESPAGSQGIRVELVGIDVARMIGESSDGGES
jgi:hypothetical protein